MEKKKMEEKDDINNSDSQKEIQKNGKFFCIELNHKVT